MDLRKIIEEAAEELNWENVPPQHRSTIKAVYNYLLETFGPGNWAELYAEETTAVFQIIRKFGTPRPTHVDLFEILNLLAHVGLVTESNPKDGYRLGNHPPFGAEDTDFFGDSL